MRDGAIALLVGAIGSGVAWVAVNIIGKPLLTIQETRASISKALAQYEGEDTSVSITPPVGVDPAEEARKTYLQLASSLISNLNAIPFYGFWSLIRLLPSQYNIHLAHHNLMELSMMSGKPGCNVANARRRREIIKALRLKQ